MDTVLPDGTPLPQSWALQDPRDYLEVLDSTIPALLRESGVDPKDIVGIGVDFTSSTPMPVDAQGTPLCFYEEYAREPHALVKLWKHHGAQDQADRITALAQERQESWLPRFGGRISSEMSLPKLLQVLEEAPHIYHAMSHWMEAGDWIVWQLTGQPAQSACAAGSGRSSSRLRVWTSSSPTCIACSR
jgi:L-ribulokinase